MLKRIVGGLLIAGPMLLCGTAVAQAEDLEPAPDCVEYSSNQGTISAVTHCVGGLYLESDIDQCKYLGRSQTWATIDGRLYLCSPTEPSTTPSTGSI